MGEPRAIAGSGPLVFKGVEATRQADGGPRRVRRRLSVDRRREELISVALELFGTRDPEDVSIDDVAARAGASRALVYHYFGGKQELYLAALRSAAEELEARLRPPGDVRLRPLDELARGLKSYFDFVEEHAAGFAALLRGGPANRSGEVGEIVDGVRQRLLRLILNRMHIGTPGPVLRVTLRSWIASVETAGLDWLEHRDMDRGALERMLVDHMIALLQVAERYDGQVAHLLERLLSGD
ncbi:MAG: TetR/AcrR family transcriptional regulator [Thermobispora bispora]|jgi:AcrR family transcriptional regulator|nr:TetR/AcrR family transcriptional regulator [Actinomycetales bacterium]MBX6167915.1 TetR/AcrR family transcriptional regulator [Thermobispora bispora]QSI46494.1 TetR/AcrR family transcriptional regulator [Thermobispora bispora]